MSQTDLAPENRFAAGRVNTGALLVLALVFAELVGIGLIYKHLIDFRCLSNWPAGLCRGASMTMVGAYTGAGALLLLGFLLPDDRRALLAEAGLRPRGLILNLAGVGAMLAPLPFFVEGSGTTYLAPIFAFWSLGAILGGAGTALMLAPVARWKPFLATRGMAFALCLLAGALVPYLSQKIFPLWRLSGVADLTFVSVARLMEALGYDIRVIPETKTIGTETFGVNVAPVCSGIEGIALVTIFVTIYLVLFRKVLKFPAALLLYPLGIFASWLLNVVRIAALLAIGIGGNPELAVGGFHSHAGWLMFTALSLTILWLAQGSRWFSRQPVAATGSGPARAQMPPLNRDPVAAAILPFAVFMGSALLASTFSTDPGVVYPLRVLAMSAALLFFWPVLKGLALRIDPLSLAVGAGVGVMWIVTAAPSDGSVPYGTLTGILLAGWVILRIFGTVVLVPVIEELFFRHYLVGLIAPRGAPAWRMALAVGLTTAAFAALHDRWIVAAIAGLAFAALYLRRREVGDAIQSHAIANAVVAAAALIMGNWGLI